MEMFQNFDSFEVFENIEDFEIGIHTLDFKIRTEWDYEHTECDVYVKFIKKKNNN